MHNYFHIIVKPELNKTEKKLNIKGDSSPKNVNAKLSFTHPYVIPNLTFFILWITKYILKNVGNQTFLVPSNFYFV